MPFMGLSVIDIFADGRLFVIRFVDRSKGVMKNRIDAQPAQPEL